MRGIGFDFGTTNSALAVAEGVPDARVQVAEFAATGGPTTAFRSVVFFGREDDKAPVETAAGPSAIERYLALDEERRLMQSLKSFLGSDLFTGTSVFGRRMDLEALIGCIVTPLKETAEQQLGPITPPVVVGRPVRFAKARDEADDRLAISRLEAAMWEAGFPEVTFEYEPVAAAYHYEQGLDHDELVLIADFGGGTSDFTLIRVGPGVRGKDRGDEHILGSTGVALAGDAFDAKIVRHVVAERLGRGSLRKVFMGGDVPIPNWIYRDLEHWHHLSFLKSPKTMEFLHEALEGSLEPEKLEALLHLVEYDLGYELYQAVQRTKNELSVADSSRFCFANPPVRIEHTIRREDFESWIAEELEAIASCVDELFAATGVRVEQVDRVFMTGGSSFVPAVRRIFEERFGRERIRGGDELVSVARGLALRALDGA